MRHDYQHFGAYYTITEVFNDPTDYRHGQPVLYGSPRLHYIRCSEDVFYIRLAKDPQEALLDIDKAGEFLCDFRLDSADGQTLAMTYMLTGDTSGMHPVTQTLIAQDEAEGLDREAIIEKRAGIMTVEFLGFVPAHVFEVRPELAEVDVIEIDSGSIWVENEVIFVPRFSPGNWHIEDNPEFL